MDEIINTKGDWCLWEFYCRYLVPLIKDNLESRCLSAVAGDDKYPDEWFWADEVGVDWGFYYDPVEGLPGRFKELLPEIQ